MIMRQVGGAEMNAEQVREIEDRMLADELVHLDRRLADQTISDAERTRITERRRRLVELQRRLASPTEREAARSLLHEHLRARYQHHRGRTGGSRVAWGMIIDEALTLALSALAL
jgi:hypothetical protein